MRLRLRLVQQVHRSTALILFKRSGTFADTTDAIIATVAFIDTITDMVSHILHLEDITIVATAVSASEVSADITAGITAVTIEAITRTLW